MPTNADSVEPFFTVTIDDAPYADCDTYSVAQTEASIACDFGVSGEVVQIWKRGELFTTAVVAPSHRGAP